ncbi:LacI family transcriptional regulator [Kaistia sp. 32K]|uniref:LacI family DNA-binding transcriptional regulator n=1 Tax=Kaistia sp. 32K TaxID=2795690 RepID=UPI00191613C7|nr:LacI family DNA-binding transcriptional regulator [Kaistia sp. 32K]BCP53642.1 LacI family transcriptional regulator [Kaistia sp. 32K]
MNVKNSYTLADVALRAEVSEITVSRVLRNKASVAEKTRERVLAVVREMGYVPNRVAGTLASSGSNLIGVVLPSLSNIVFPDVLRGIHASLASSGYQPVVGVTDYDEDVEEQLVASLLSWQPAAMILSGLNHTAYTVEMLKRSGVRVAELMDIDATPLDIAVGMSHRQAGIDTALHLYRRGYRRFGYVGHDRSRDLRAARRYEGLRQGLAEVGLSLVGEIAADAPSSTMAGRELLGQLLARHRDLDAVVFSNDDMAVGGVFHCFAAGIRLREDLALFGFNGLDIGQALPQPLSTIRSNRFLIGKTAAEMILEVPEHPGVPTIRDTGYEIIEGATA